MLDNVVDLDVNDISPHWKGSTPRERQIIARIIKLDKTPHAAMHLAKHAGELSDYWYWYMVGTLWVGYSGFIPLGTWRSLFNSPRPNRAECLMKPSELRMLARMPSVFFAYRAPRDGETDWIAYTLDIEVALRFARERGSKRIDTYRFRREDVLALFARRREAEIIVCNRCDAVIESLREVQA